MTLCLWELAGTPIEILFNGEKYTYLVIFDKNNKITEIINLSNSSRNIPVSIASASEAETPDTETEAGTANPLRIKKWEYDQEAQKAVFVFDVLSEDADIFALRQWATQQIRRICNDEYTQANPGSTKGLLGFSLVSKLDMPVLSVNVTVHRILPMSHSYDAATRIGTLKMNIGQRGDANYTNAYRWALDNIGVICSSKEVGMEAGMPPPEGARYRIVSEKTADDGALEITFEVLQ
ncbi:MAG: hypothetical protein FWH21_02235 [Kiritimatiellaeota bacterium]|nr:hypothetical protein [Kiritimatiellota bacterium]